MSCSKMECNLNKEFYFLIPVIKGNVKKKKKKKLKHSNFKRASAYLNLSEILPGTVRITMLFLFLRNFSPYCILNLLFYVSIIGL